MEPAIKRGFTMAEACQYLGGISRPTLYRLMGRGEIESYHLGVRRYFTREALDKLIDTLLGKRPEVDERIGVLPEEDTPVAKGRRGRMGPYFAEPQG